MKSKKKEKTQNRFIRDINNITRNNMSCPEYTDDLLRILFNEHDAYLDTKVWAHTFLLLYLAFSKNNRCKLYH